MLTSVIRRCLYKKKLVGLIAPGSRVYHATGKEQHCTTCTRSTRLKRQHAITSRACSNWPDYRQGYELPMVDDIPLLSPLPFIRSSFFPIVAFFKVRLQIDPEFDLDEFFHSCVQALSVVSNALANADYNALHDLVAEDTLERLKEHISKLSPEQRCLMAVQPNDITCQFPYMVKVRNVARDDGTIENIVRVNILYYYYPKYDAHDDDDEEEAPPLLQLINQSVMCNYSFQRTYVNKTGGPWIVVSANHFTYTSYMKNLNEKYGKRQ